MNFPVAKGVAASVQLQQLVVATTGVPTPEDTLLEIEQSIEQGIEQGIEHVQEFMLSLGIVPSILLLILAAIIIVPLFKRLSLGSVLGYLAAGVVAGPSIPAIANDVEGIRSFAELGVVLLMFLIGLELKPAKLWSMRGTVFGLGTIQILVTGVLIAGYCLLLKIPADVAAIAGFTLALSSTAIGLQILGEKGELNSEHGNTAFGILLMQDIAVVPLLALVPLIAHTSTVAAVGGPFYLILLKVLGALGVIFGVTRYLTRLLIPLLIGNQLVELSFAFLLAIVFGAGWLMEEVGLSMTLGAFIAGLMLSDSEYRYQIEAELLIHRDLLLGLFFMAVGMSVDLELIREQFLLLLKDAVAILSIKAGVLYALCLAFRQSQVTAIRVALLLPQCSEFGFVLSEIAFKGKLLTDANYKFGLVMLALTMAATPLLGILSDKIAAYFQTQAFVESHAGIPLPADPPEQENHIVIVGFGRMGEAIANMLRKANVSYLAIDEDPAQAAEARQQGYEVYFGNASDSKVLQSVGITQARAALITLSNPDICTKTLGTIRELCPHLPVSCRARDLEHRAILQELGATEVVLETMEASLQLGRTALDYVGKNADYIDETVATFRQNDYALAME
jgi:glutathione-regulated potassium-efflux system protein KefB